MSCENYSWGVRIPRTTNGNKFQVKNDRPDKKSNKIWIDGEYKYDKSQKKFIKRKWTNAEIEEGYAYTKYGKLKLIPIKCNNCDLCRLNRANQWVTRIICEFKTSNQQGIKIDLTYSPKHVPEDYTLRKADYQNFINKLRQQIYRDTGKRANFKYYIGGEYGPKGGRPHYHLIIIGWMPNDLTYWKDSKTGFPMYTSEYIDKKWAMGITTIQPLTPETASYATRYTNKKSGKAKKNKNVPEFQAQSIGIGKKYWEIKKEEIIEDLGIWIKRDSGTICAQIPDYYKKLWKKERPIQYETFLDWQERQMEKIENERKQLSNLSKIEYIRNKAETASIILNYLKRSNYEEQDTNGLDTANNNGYNIHVSAG